MIYLIFPTPYLENHGDRELLDLLKEQPRSLKELAQKLDYSLVKIQNRVSRLIKEQLIQKVIV
jgi:predicted transcriptional regulator